MHYVDLLSHLLVVIFSDILSQEKQAENTKLLDTINELKNSVLASEKKLKLARDSHYTY